MISRADDVADAAEFAAKHAGDVADAARTNNNVGELANPYNKEILPDEIKELLGKNNETSEGV